MNIFELCTTVPWVQTAQDVRCHELFYNAVTGDIKGPAAEVVEQASKSNSVRRKDAQIRTQKSEERPQMFEGKKKKKSIKKLLGGHFNGDKVHKKQVL